MPEPRSAPETLSKNETKWLSQTWLNVAGEEISKKVFLLASAAALYNPETKRTVLETYQSNNLQKSHDRENKRLNDFINSTKEGANFWNDFPSTGPREGSAASRLSAADYAEKIAKARIGKILRVLIRDGRRGYAKPNYTGPRSNGVASTI